MQEPHPFAFTLAGKQRSLQKVPSHKLLVQPLSERSGTPLDKSTGSLQGGNLALGTALATGDDGTSVAHSAAGRSSDTGNEGNDGFVRGVVGLEELGGILLGGTTDLADHDDTVSLGVVQDAGVFEGGRGAGELYVLY